MKNKYTTKLATILAVSLLLLSCKKEEEKEMFAGKARIRGTVYIRNLIKGTVDTAKTASLTLRKTDGDASEYYTINLTNGTYDIVGLTGGAYVFSMSYTSAVAGSTNKINYKQDFSIQVAKDELKANEDLTIEDSALTGPVLLIKVLDANGSSVKNAQVCLFTDPTMQQKNANRCSVSAKSGTTNDAGIVAFTDLGNSLYYATAYSVIGTDTASNRNTASTSSYGPFTINRTETKSLVISADNPHLTVMVTDANGAAVSSAQVCLYSDAGLAARYGGSCTGSVKSALADQNGNVIFSNMQSIPYYVFASKTVGTDLLSNLSMSLTPTMKLVSGVQNRVSIVLAPEKPVLEVTVLDINGAQISNAQVCIYSDLSLINKYGYKCTGSLRSATSDQNGATMFGNMQPIPYYISASKAIGKDTLSNASTIMNATPKLGAQQPNKITVVIN